MPSPSSSNTMPQSQPNPSTFQSPTPCSSSNPPQTSHGGLTSGSHVNSANSPNTSMHQATLSGDIDANDSQSSVQKIIHEMMMSSQLGGGGLVGGGASGMICKSVNGLITTANNSILNGSSCLVGNGTANANIGISPGYGNMGNGLSQAAMANGIRAALGNSSVAMNGRVGMPMAREQSVSQQQQDLGNQLLVV
uniref:S25-PR6 n=1 Tax=Nicotiana tabacum TaxID=4097 RepID=Q40461_TOBAC|nr:S25-PR6 [Nicotiana tabacum]